ncbi:MAG: hypothetical protein LBD17_05735 [Endomicrobium sp.]|jgi:hypothetical protein|nr:hypothetical protein [Endomicrobium sp.]
MKKFSLVLGVIFVFVFAFHMVSLAQPYRFINSDSLMQAFDKFENSKVVYNQAMTELNKRTEANDFLTILHVVNLDPDNQQYVAAAE